MTGTSDDPEDLTSAAPTDLTVELRPEHGDDEAVADDEFEATVAPADYWQPRTRLATRLEPSRRQPTAARSNRQWWIAALIVVGAVIVAIALWLAALWAQGRDDADVEPESAVEVTAHTVSSRSGW